MNRNTPRMQSSSTAILALDVGGQRIGVARANPIARMASPLTTLINDAAILDTIAALIVSEDCGTLVVGLPRGLDGQETGQTTTVREFVAQLKPRLTVPIYFQDEAVTSRKAEAELKSRGKAYVKGDIDALAATYILEDFLQENSGVQA